MRVDKEIRAQLKDVQFFANRLAVNAVIVHEIRRLRRKLFAAVRMRPRFRRHLSVRTNCPIS